MFGGRVKPQNFWLILSGTTILSVLLIFYIINYAPKTQNNPQSIQKATQNITESKNTDLSLRVTYPLEKMATDSATLTIIGTAPKNSLVTIIGGNEDNIVQTDNNGSFSAPIILSEGENNLQIISFEKDGQERRIERLVIYSSDGL